VASTQRAPVTALATELKLIASSQLVCHYFNDLNVRVVSWHPPHVEESAQ
jgi:hypothetical protein